MSQDVLLRHSNDVSKIQDSKQARGVYKYIFTDITVYNKLYDRQDFIVYGLKLRGRVGQPK